MRGIALAIMMLAFSLQPSTPAPPGSKDISFLQMVEMVTFVATIACIIAGI